MHAWMLFLLSRIFLIELQLACKMVSCAWRAWQHAALSCFRWLGSCAWQVGEDPALSQPVSVDLQALFTDVVSAFHFVVTKAACYIYKYFILQVTLCLISYETHFRRSILAKRWIWAPIRCAFSPLRLEPYINIRVSALLAAKLCKLCQCAICWICLRL